MKFVILTLFILTSCTSNMHYFSRVVLQDNNKSFNELSNGLSKIIFYLDDPYPHVKVNASSETVLACKINGYNSFILRDKMTTRVNVTPGKHKIDCYKFYDIKDENYIWRHARKITGQRSNIIEIKEGEIKTFSLHYNSPVVKEMNKEIDFNQYTFIRAVNSSPLITYKNIETQETKKRSPASN